MVGIGILAHLAENALHGLGHLRGDQRIGERIAERVHIFLGQPQASLAIHRGEVHLVGFACRQNHMGVLADLTVDDVHIHHEEATGIDRRHNCIDHLFPGSARGHVDRILDHVGPALVHALVFGCVQRRLVVVASPDVVHAAQTPDQELVDIFRRSSNMAFGRAEISLLVTAKSAGTTTFAANVTGCQRDVHQRADRAVIVVAPDDALLVAGHAFAAAAVIMRLGNPFGRLLDVGGLNATDFRCLGQRSPACLHRVVEAAKACGMRLVLRHGFATLERRVGDELRIDPALIHDMGQQSVEQHHVRAFRNREVQDVLGASILFRGRDGQRATRIDDDHLRAGLQTFDHVVQVKIGLGLHRVRTDHEDRVGQLVVLVSVVQLVHAHVPRGMDLGIIGGAVVDAAVL